MGQHGGHWGQHGGNGGAPKATLGAAWGAVGQHGGGLHTFSSMGRPHSPPRGRDAIDVPQLSQHPLQAHAAAPCGDSGGGGGASNDPLPIFWGPQWLQPPFMGPPKALSPFQESSNVPIPIFGVPNDSVPFMGSPMTPSLIYGVPNIPVPIFGVPNGSIPLMGSPMALPPFYGVPNASNPHLWDPQRLCPHFGVPNGSISLMGSPMAPFLLWGPQ